MRLKLTSLIFFFLTFIFGLFFSSNTFASTLQWTERTVMPTPRAYFGITTYDGKIYAIGGEYSLAPAAPGTDKVEVYNPGTNTWATKANMLTPRTSLATVLANNGKIYAIGGSDGNNPVGTVEEYDPNTDTWTSRANLPSPRAALGASLGSDGKIYVVGGISLSESQTNTVYAYDPDTDTWTTRASMPTPRSYLAVTADSAGKIYAIGGIDFSGQYCSGRCVAVEAYDPDTDTWTTKANLPSGISQVGVTTYGNKIYIMGSDFSTSNLGVVEEYDTDINTWTTLENMPTSRSALGAAISGGKIYAIGGYSINGGVQLSDVNEEGTFVIISPTPTTTPTPTPTPTPTDTPTPTVTPTPTLTPTPTNTPTPTPIPVPTSVQDCQNGGWMNFTNPSFQNQGQCIHYVNSH